MSDLPLPEPTRDEALTIQHDLEPAEDHGIAKRIPHMGHAALFFSLTGFCIFAAFTVFLIAVHATTAEAAKGHPVGEIVSQIVAYIVVLLASVPLFAFIWKKPFLEGVQWAWRSAKRYWWQLIGLGILCSVVAQMVDKLLKTPGETDLMRYFQTPGAAWTLVIGGGVIFPLMEEVAFRGFLLPAIATAYDWFSLERTPADLQRWQQTTSHTRNALIFAAIFSSLPFTLIHGAQLHWAASTLSVLFAVSLIFAAVRIYFNSLAASTIVHIAYDGLIFLELIIATGGFRHFDKLT